MIAKPVLKMKKVGERIFSRLHTPEKVLPNIKSKHDLHHTLDWYSHPFIKLRTPDSPQARRRYVELVRPALRWFCQKFGVAVPKWLEGNGHYDQMDEEAHNDFFGPDPLKVQEFEELEHANPDEPLKKPASLENPKPKAKAKPEAKKPKS